MIKKFSKSNEYLERARKITPLGAQTFSKSFRYFCEGYSPSFIESGNGCYLVDVDGNRYIDFICALGAITVGYNDERVNQAIVSQLQKGILFSQQAENEIFLAEKIVKIIKCAEMVRFVKNGGDATSAAIRLARAYTGKDIVLVCGYHGMHDWYIGSTNNNRGIPVAVRELTKTFEYNCIDSLKSEIERNKGRIAAVILEPIQADGPNIGYLQELKDVVNQEGAVLIFDEVVSGFRYALGGASELYNVVPDLCAFGKGIANGMPLSAVAGKKDILKLIEEGVFISTTFGGEALSIAAAIKTIEILSEPGVYEEFWRLGNIMIDGLKKSIKKYKLEDVLSVSGLAPHAGIVFEGTGSLSYLDINSIFQQTMIENGILTVGINNINKSHTDKEVNTFIDVADKAMILIKKAIEMNSIEGVLKGGKVDPVFKRNINRTLSLGGVLTPPKL